MPHCYFATPPICIEDCSLEVLRTFRSQLLQCPALGRVRLLHEDQRLAHRERRADLSKTILREAPKQVMGHMLVGHMSGCSEVCEVA